jgi:twitching motility protein PilI
MAKKTSLRDFQEYLAARADDRRQGRGSSSWLGIEPAADLVG